LNKVISICEEALISPADLYEGCYVSDPHFFNLFEKNIKPKLIYTLDKLQNDFQSDYYLPITVRSGDAFIGFLYSFPFKEVFSRQSHSLRQFVTLFDNPRLFSPTLSRFAASKGKITELNSLYLSRIYVRSSFQGMRIGESLIDKFESKAKSQGYSSLSLHVHVENLMAQKFYIRLGFKFVDKNSSGYLSMEKLI
jgi:GNAT superfamily N-acetyltransferase